MALMELSDTVGAGGANRPDDVKRVQQRLKALGFGFFGNANGQVNTGLILTLKLFQGVIAGRNTVSGDGLVNLKGRTHTWLSADNAPRWVLMPAEGPGFVNFERRDDRDHHDFGTSWLAEVLTSAGAQYQADHRDLNPKAAVLAINDVSLPEGGDTPDHAGHETGLACDLLLPRRGGDSGGITWKSASFDRAAARAMIEALRAQPLVASVLFNDPQLVGEGLCHSHAGHDNHIHFDIRPPAPRV